MRSPVHLFADDPKQARFLALVADVRPDLHRYCARMTGSVVDGEDIVQETLARAFQESHVFLDAEGESRGAGLRRWLFHVAHRQAIDYLRRYERRMGRPLDDDDQPSAENDAGGEEAVIREEAVHAAIARFLELPPVQRSCVVLRDVLGHSAEEVGALLGIGVPAVKSALHRGRESLGRKRAKAEHEPVAPTGSAVSPTLAQYAALFEARDWDGVRALLTDDVRLDLVSRAQRSGRRDVSTYFTNYAGLRGWHVRPAWLEGEEVLAVFLHDEPAPAYLVRLTLRGSLVAAIRDFRYVPYITRDAAVEIVVD